MAKQKQVVINDELTLVEGRSLADVVPADVVSVTTRQGQTFRREDFDKTPIPEGFETNLSAINKGGRHQSTLSGTQKSG